MAAAFGDFLACPVRRQLRPLRHDVEVARDLEQGIEDERPRFGDCLFHRQDAHEVIAYAQVVTLGFDIGIADLAIQELGGLRITGNAPIVEVQQPTEEPELARRIGDTLVGLCREGLTILMVEHELAIMDEFCDPVVVMAEGSVLAEGTMGQLRARSEVVEAYLVG